MKGKILSKAKNLRSSDNDSAKQIFIKPDLTPMQQEVEKKLVEELNIKNAEAKAKNEPLWMIKKMKLIQKPTRQDTGTNTITTAQKTTGWMAWLAK